MLKGFLQLTMALLALGAAPATAQGNPAVTDEVIAADQAIADYLMANVQSVRTDRIHLWVQPNTLTTDEAQAFAGELEKGLLAIERLTGERVDDDHYGGSTIHVFVSGRVRVSHVYGGYSHQHYDRPYLYLNPNRIRNREAPYLHELTHIVLWRFGSHSLREGFASYVEGHLAGSGVGYNSGIFGPGPRAEVDKAAAALLGSSEAAALLPWIGRSGAIDASLTSADQGNMRAAFYLLTRSFVQHLLDEMDVASFIRLYRAEDTEAAYRDLTGRSLDEWRQSWRQSLAAKVPNR